MNRYEIRRRGFTLVELLIVMAITGVLMSAMWIWIGDKRDELGQRDAELAWRAQAANSFTHLARDARGAQGVHIEADGLRLGFTGAGDVIYRLKEGELIRRGPEGALALAQGVRRLDLSQEDHQLKVALDFERGYGGRHASAHHQTVIALRVQP